MEHKELNIAIKILYLSIITLKTMAGLNLFANYERIETKFDDFSGDFDLVGFIRQAQHDPELMQTILAGSYIHDNGFYKITLFDDAVHKLRLHIWTNSKGDYMENIHNHRWDLHSRILIGSYKNELYVRGAGGERYHEYSYRPHNGGQSYEFFYVGICDLKCVNTIEKFQGDQVFLGHEEIHRVSPSSDYTASLFLSGGPHKMNTEVFSKSQYDQGNVAYHYLSLQELEFLFEDFLTRIAHG